jgi:hypothetical protein
MMLRRCCLVKHTTGETGAYVAAVTVSTSGQMQQLLSCLTVAMGGLGSFSMGSLRRCTRAEVPRVEPIAQVSVAAAVRGMYKQTIVLWHKPPITKPVLIYIALTICMHHVCLCINSASKINRS